MSQKPENLVNPDTPNEAAEAVEATTPTYDRGKATFKFILMSAIGIIYFFVPVIPDGGEWSTPLVWSLSFIKALIAPIHNWLLVAAIILLLIFVFLGKTGDHPFFKKHFGETGPFSFVLYAASLVFALMIIFQVGPYSVICDAVGGESLALGKSVMITIIIAGFMVPFLVDYGFLDFIGALINPLMRPLFKLPGEASIDAVTSFVSSATVGVYVTSKLYVSKHYTTREACAIATNFSFVSMGFYAVVCETAGVMKYYNQVILWSLLLLFIMAAIMIRVWPLCKKPNEYYDGTPFEPDSEERKKFSAHSFVDGFNAAVEKAGTTPVWKNLGETLVSVTMYSLKIAAFILSITTVAFFIQVNTSLFDIIGLPFIPILNLLGIPDAEGIASACLLSITDLAVPASVAAAAGASEMACFFIVVLTGLQIIMFSECSLAILESEIPLNMLEQIIIFLVRTVFAIPLAAIVTHIVFGF
ncbi:MAG: hypothetical protein LUE63_07345 [Lachnospiraceae bacterium]|nr:hypothetical protein [Lachnospiraceae bacterium]